MSELSAFDRAVSECGTAGGTVSTRPAPASRNDLAPQSRGPGQWWDVCEYCFPFGLADRLGRLQAHTRAEAEAIAAERWPGKPLLVSLAIRGKPRKPYDHSKRRTR